MRRWRWSEDVEVYVGFCFDVLSIVWYGVVVDIYDASVGVLLRVSCLTLSVFVWSEFKSDGFFVEFYLTKMFMRLLVGGSRLPSRQQFGLRFCIFLFVVIAENVFTVVLRLRWSWIIELDSFSEALWFTYRLLVNGLVLLSPDVVQFIVQKNELEKEPKYSTSEEHVLKHLHYVQLNIKLAWFNVWSKLIALIIVWISDTD